MEQKKALEDLRAKQNELFAADQVRTAPIQLLIFKIGANAL